MGGNVGCQKVSKNERKIMVEGFRKFKKGAPRNDKPMIVRGLTHLLTLV